MEDDLKPATFNRTDAMCFCHMNEQTARGWMLFLVGLSILLAVDLFVHRGGKEESWRAALAWSIVWIAAGLGFGGLVWGMLGATPAQDYLATYLLEKSLSLDNLFVFLLIYQTLNIPTRYQRTALSWGIFGALVFRAVFIFAGAAAIARWNWLEFVFAAVLIWAAIRIFFENPATEKESRLVNWLSARLPVTQTRDTPKFFLREQGRLMATPLLVAVLSLELCDILFAVDSVPAALAVARNPFIVYTSNAFAILGLRALYILLAHTIAELRYLHYGLAAVLLFVGVKMAADRWVKIGPLASVGVIVLALTVSVGLSLWRQRDVG